MHLAPIGVPQAVVIGTHDAGWAPSGRAYLRHVQTIGDTSVQGIEATESGHFEMIVPSTSTWPLVVDALKGLDANTSQ